MHQVTTVSATDVGCEDAFPSPPTQETDGAQGVSEDGKFLIHGDKVQGAQDDSKLSPRGGGFAQDADGDGGVTTGFAVAVLSRASTGGAIAGELVCTRTHRARAGEEKACAHAGGRVWGVIGGHLGGADGPISSSDPPGC